MKEGRTKGYCGLRAMIGRRGAKDTRNSILSFGSRTPATHGPLPTTIVHETPR